MVPALPRRRGGGAAVCYHRRRDGRHQRLPRLLGYAGGHHGRRRHAHEGSRRVRQRAGGGLVHRQTRRAGLRRRAPRLAGAFPRRGGEDCRAGEAGQGRAEGGDRPPLRGYRNVSAGLSDACRHVLPRRPVGAREAAVARRGLGGAQAVDGRRATRPHLQRQRERRQLLGPFWRAGRKDRPLPAAVRSHRGILQTDRRPHGRDGAAERRGLRQNRDRAPACAVRLRLPVEKVGDIRRALQPRRLRIRRRARPSRHPHQGAGAGHHLRPRQGRAWSARRTRLTAAGG
ncbi:MAG: hypothetical protein BWY76_03107 [bacterium ADurb.Bin429]|nr:MAG: hypothetical protein BWY76_03107 [bacterium ADurb.Bin429]